MQTSFGRLGKTGEHLQWRFWKMMVQLRNKFEAWVFVSIQFCRIWVWFTAVYIFLSLPRCHFSLVVVLFPFSLQLRQCEWRASGELLLTNPNLSKQCRESFLLFRYLDSVSWNVKRKLVSLYQNAYLGLSIFKLLLRIFWKKTSLTSGIACAGTWRQVGESLPSQLRFMSAIAVSGLAVEDWDVILWCSLFFTTATLWVKSFWRTLIDDFKFKQAISRIVPFLQVSWLGIKDAIRIPQTISPTAAECYPIEATVGPHLQGVSAEILSFP
jgi:hypothetical protein